MFSNPWYSQPAGQGSQNLLNPYAIENTGDGESTDEVDDVLFYLEALQSSLRPGWTVHVTEDGRLSYCNHVAQTSSWIPPADCWDSSSQASETSSGLLPYGWESALDRQGKPYFINHLNKTTTYEDPRKDWFEEPPQPRDVDLQRHPDVGFGFVAGSEKPVIVRFVTEHGPSQNKLLPGDQIWRINGEDVQFAPRDHVISLIKSCKELVQLTVCQPPLDNSSRKSALLSAAKKARLKSNPSRVRFAEGVVVSGTSPPLGSSWSGSEYPEPPIIPNVLKVYLENGQTKSFKYDSSTTVADVISSLQQKLGIKAIENFGLYVEHIRSLRRNRMTLLDPGESLARIAARPGAQNLRCLFRIAFVPREAYDLLKKDPVAFEYLYVQCCNDVVHERFAPELQYDVALKLAALHIQQYAAVNSASPNSKLTIKHVEREFGLERFVPASLLESMKRKELHKLLSHNLKSYGSGTLTSSGRKPVSILQAKLLYLQIVRELPSYGAKCFPMSLQDNLMEAVILVSPKYGVSQISGLGGTAQPTALCDIEEIISINAKRAEDSSQSIEISLKEPKEAISITLEDGDADELVLVLRGYHRLFADRVIPVTREKDKWADDGAPPYHTRHTVVPAAWSFLPAKFEVPLKDGEKPKSFRHVDLSLAPPYQAPPKGFQIPSFDSRISDSDSMSIMSSSSPIRTRVPGHDRNMNKPLPNNNSLDRSSNLSFYDNNSISSSRSRVNDGEYIYQIPAPRQSVGFDEPSVVSIELLETGSRNDEGQKLLPKSPSPAKLEPGTPEACLSDSESAGSPHDSPTAKLKGRVTSMLKPSDSSFGLHSPDMIPSSIAGNSTDIKDLMKRLQGDPTVKLPEGTLYLDPDIIDLTMLPPPITPDEENLKSLLNTLNAPPTPFADKEFLEGQPGGELDNAEELGELSDLARWSLYNVPSHSSYAESDSSVYDAPTFRRPPSSDIDSFIANVTIPPPPAVFVRNEGPMADIELITTDDLSAFIIPPPPSSGNTASGLEVLRRLYEAKEGIFQVIRGDVQFCDDEQDCGVAEMRLHSEKIERNPEDKYSSRVTNTAKMVTQNSMQKQDSTQSLSSNSSTSSGYASLRPSPQNRDPPNLPSKSPTSPTKTLRHSSLPSNPSSDIPPPPPPRIPLSQLTSVRDMTSRINRLSAPNFKTAPMQRSSSQGDLIEELKKDPAMLPSPVASKTLPHRSQSSEPAMVRVILGGEEYRRPLSPSPSKSSVTSSSGDSLGSNVSVATVKEMSLGQLDLAREEKEESPPLPPRNSPKKEVARPPLPVSILKDTRTAYRSPSLDDASAEPASPKPALPSRMKKPYGNFSAPTSPQRMPGVSGYGKPAARSPKGSPSSSPISSPASVATLRKPGSLQVDAGAPLAQPEAALTPIDDYKPLRFANQRGRIHPANGVELEGRRQDDNISVDSGSFDQDSLDGSDIDLDALLSQAEEVVNRVVLELNSKKRLVLSQPTAESEMRFQASHEKLLNDSRQFVTASKLFVKSATESAGAMALCLSQCLVLVEKMKKSAIDLAATPGRLQLEGAELSNKVKDVAQSFFQTIVVTREVTGRSIGDPAMGKLMNKATALAGVLTVLMRALRPT